MVHSSLTCSCAVSPQEGLELALTWTVKNKLFEISICAEREEDILGQEGYEAEPIGTSQRLSLSICQLDANSVVLDCAMLKAVLYRFAACAEVTEAADTADNEEYDQDPDTDAFVEALTNTFSNGSDLWATAKGHLAGFIRAR